MALKEVQDLDTCKQCRITKFFFALAKRKAKNKNKPLQKPGKGDILASHSSINGLQAAGIRTRKLIFGAKASVSNPWLRPPFGAPRAGASKTGVPGGGHGGSFNLQKPEQDAAPREVPSGGEARAGLGGSTPGHCSEQAPGLGLALARSGGNDTTAEQDVQSCFFPVPCIILKGGASTADAPRPFLHHHVPERAGTHVHAPNSRGCASRELADCACAAPPRPFAPPC